MNGSSRGLDPHLHSTVGGFVDSVRKAPAKVTEIFNDWVVGFVNESNARETVQFSLALWHCNVKKAMLVGHQRLCRL